MDLSVSILRTSMVSYILSGSNPEARHMNQWGPILGSREKLWTPSTLHLDLCEFLTNAKTAWPILSCGQRHVKSASEVKQTRQLCGP